MGMTAKQAKALGVFIAKARIRRGVTIRALSAQLGVATGWLARVEAGHYADPAPDRLARLAEALEIEPARIDRLTKGAVSGRLPEPRVYFRAKMALTDKEADQVVRYIQRLRRAA